ncbi:hypothetical protein KC367_g185 [Hortaea werneckii]|nr:hypothetical protein KC367_g185 [Hortaea werneckii]
MYQKRFLGPYAHLQSASLIFKRFPVPFLKDLVEGWDQSLCQPEGEGELGASHEKLRNQALEERRWPFLSHHVRDNLRTALLDLEVAVLYPSLDNVKGRGDNKGSGGTGDGGDEVLEPAGLVVVLELEEVLLGRGRASEEGERTWRIACRRPAPSSVQAEALVANDSQDATATERLRVCLPLDLQHVQRQQDDLANADQTSGGRVHHGLAGTLAKGAVEGAAMVLGKVVAHEWLSSVLVYSLKHLVCCGVSETGEEGEESAESRLVGGVLEDDRVELGAGGHTALVGHEALGDRVDGVEDDEFVDSFSAFCAEPTTGTLPCCGIAGAIAVADGAHERIYVL